MVPIPPGDQGRTVEAASAAPRPPSRLERLTGGSGRVAGYAPAYTRLVRRLRIILPVAALVVVAGVLLWPRIVAEFNHPTRPSQEERQARMVNGRYVGSDAHGRPYTVTYESAQQAPGGGPIEMINPVAELTLDNGRWVAIRADHGRYDQGGGKVDLSGKVELFHDEGYRFTTEIAHVEFAGNIIWGDRAVKGRGPKGEIAARGFRVTNNGQVLAFTGPTRMLLRPEAAHLVEPASAPK